MLLRNMDAKVFGQMLPRFFGCERCEILRGQHRCLWPFLRIKRRGICLLMIAPRDMMPHDYLFNFLFYHVVHLAFIWENGIGRFAALLFILRPPAMTAQFIRCAICAVRQPRQRAGNYHRIQRVMPQIAAIFFRELFLFCFRQFIPTLARREVDAKSGSSPMTCATGW